MQTIWPILTSLLLLASPDAQPADAPSGWLAVLEHYAGLDQAGRQQWIHDLLGRLHRANWVVLAPGEAAGRQASYTVLLRQSAQGRTIPQAELLKLLRQTDQQEKAAIERLARRFRIRVYDTFRLQRDQYARRRAAWDWVRASWEAAGRPFDQQPWVIDWLEAAIRSSTPGSVAPLPDVPSAEPPAKVSRALVIQQPPERIGQPPPTIRRELVLPPQPVRILPQPLRPAPELQTPAEPGGKQMQSAGPPPLPLPPALPHRVSDGPPASGRAAADRPAATPPQQPAELPLVSGESAPVSAPPMPLSSWDVAALVAGNAPRHAAVTLPKISGQPASTLPPADRAVRLAPPTPAERLSAPHASLAGASRAGQPPPRTAHGPAALLPDSLRVPPAASQVARPSPQPPPARPPHRVNLAELATRIAGTNLALQALEAGLEEDHPWDARRLGPLVDRLGILVMRRSDLAVFYGVVSPQERARVGRLDSPQRAISRLAARIFEARTHASGPDFTGNEAQRQAELRELDELSSQLAEMASRK
jgi:hypothetical protein